jgi:glycosyltransferase involved in cell wall biosynthesis
LNPVPPRVAHLTTVHLRRDTRIFEKQTSSLAEAGYDVHLLVADGAGDETAAGVHIHDIGQARGGRPTRMLMQSVRMWRAARRLRAALVHFHDPELLWVGLALRLGGAQVIYDSHEDVARDILSKSWIAPRLRPWMSRAVEFVEDVLARRLSAVVAATPHIARRFAPVARQVVDINNYPVLKLPPSPAGGHEREPRTVCYVGTIEPIRGIFEMIRALEHVQARLVLAGPFDTEATEAAARALPGWAKVDYRGRVGRADAWTIMATASVGLVVLHPAPNHTEAQPTKMFEYMAAGLPVLASHFPLWRQIVEATGSGACVDPMDAAAMGRALDAMLADAPRLRQMGCNGQRAVLQAYSWPPEAAKLVALYAQLVGPARTGSVEAG